MMPKTIGELFRYKFKEELKAFTNSGPGAVAELASCETATTCGWSCMEAITRTKDLLDKLDRHPNVRNNILKGLVAHLEVVYFG